MTTADAWQPSIFECWIDDDDDDNDDDDDDDDGFVRKSRGSTDRERVFGALWTTHTYRQGYMKLVLG